MRRHWATINRLVRTSAHLQARMLARLVHIIDVLASSRRMPLTITNSWPSIIHCTINITTYRWSSEPMLELIQLITTTTIIILPYISIEEISPNWHSARRTSTITKVFWTSANFSRYIFRSIEVWVCRICTRRSWLEENVIVRWRSPVN